MSLIICMLQSHICFISTAPEAYYFKYSHGNEFVSECVGGGGGGELGRK